jgi:tetratricopeptide (TPR) repeat protein
MLTRRQREARSQDLVESSDTLSGTKPTHLPPKILRIAIAELSTLISAGLICLQPIFAANLTIKFSDPGGKILSKVSVRITHLITKRFEEELSDGQGQVVVAGLTAGKYELLAQLKNFFPIKEEIELTGDQALERVMFNQKFVDKANKEVAEATEKGEYAKAAETVQRLLKLFPDSAALHYNMAVAQGGLLNEEKATAEMDTAIRLDPGAKYQEKKKEILRDLFRELGQKALNEHDFPRAASLYQKLTEVDPQNGQGFYGLALALGHQQKYLEALTAVNQAIKLAPNEQQYQKVKEMLEANAKSH